ncbi:MAG: hypothetical protein ACRCUT_10165, partial [Spirochaetota bacterium]
QILRLFRRFLPGILCIMCAGTAAYSQTIKVARGIPVTENDLRTALSLPAEQPEKTEILIYGYESPKEIYTLGADEALIVRTEPGKLEALVRILDGEKVKKALFASGKGLDRSEMLTELASEIRRLIAH